MEFNPQRFHEASTITQALDFVASGAGVALVSIFAIAMVKRVTLGVRKHAMNLVIWRYSCPSGPNQVLQFCTEPFPVGSLRVKGMER